MAIWLHAQVSLFRLAPQPWQSPSQSSLQITCAGALNINVCPIISSKFTSSPSIMKASYSSNASSSKLSLTKKPSIAYSIGTLTSSKHLAQLSNISKLTVASK